MDGFQLVKRSALSTRGQTGVCSVRYGQKSGRLHFSKGTSEFFGQRHLALVQFNEETQTLRFTAYDQVPRGMEEADLFLIMQVSMKGKFIETAIAAKRLLTHLGIDPVPGHWPIVETNPERHTVTVKVLRKARTYDAVHEDDAHDSLARRAG